MRHLERVTRADFRWYVRTHPNRYKVTHWQESFQRKGVRQMQLRHRIVSAVTGPQ